MKPLRSLAALAALALASIEPSLATTFSYDGFTITNGQTVTINPPSGPAETVTAGQVVLSGAGANAGQNLIAWCIDVTNLLKTTDTRMFAPPPASLSPSEIAEIGAIMDFGDANIATANVSTATQLAIWETIFDPLGYTFSSAAAVESEAATILGLRLTPDPKWAALLDASTTPNQTLATPTPTREPGPLTLLGAGLLALGLVRRRHA